LFFLFIWSRALEFVSRSREPRSLRKLQLSQEAGFFQIPDKRTTTLATKALVAVATFIGTAKAIMRLLRLSSVSVIIYSPFRFRPLVYPNIGVV
jgi:hypothetical protein